jgi:exosortase A-associated hydrolase 1/exosortase A-associated hydrolase 2
MLNLYSVKGPFGALFLCDYNPSSADLILLLPPFGEEMNKTRHIIRQQAERFAELGYRVLVPDVSGTGDSDGRLAECSPDRWHCELTWLIDQVKCQGVKTVTLWAVRGGALFIPRLMIDSSLPVVRAVLWSPVLKGMQWVNQFIRLRTAAAMMAGVKESAAEIKALLQSGHTTEIAGYSVSDSSLLALESLELSSESLGNCPVVLVEVSAKGIVSPVMSKWNDSLADSSLFVAEGDSYWGTQELADASSVIEVTTSAVPKVRSVNENKPPAWVLNTSGSTPFSIPYQGQTLHGVVHVPQSLPEQAVIMVVGGPQYRVGSHQQFKLLADHFQNAGVLTLRFDYLGMGDTSGELRGFEYVEGEIRAAVDALNSQYPSLKSITLWGLCDAASAILFYAHKDARIKQLFLLNPWVRSDQSEAQAYLKHYYWSRLTSKAFWKKCLSGGLNVKESLSSLVSILNRLRNRSSGSKAEVSDPTREGSLADRCDAGMSLFNGKITLIMSGQDLTAAEFQDQVLNRAKWSSSEKIKVIPLPEADHTFSNQDMRQAVASATLASLKV